jgi:mycothiol system anti-sigma-R factor
MNCREVRATLFLFVDNEMEEERRTPFRDHVAGCPGCAKQYHYTERLLLIVRERCGRCTAPAELRTRILTSFAHRRGPLQL